MSFAKHKWSWQAIDECKKIHKIPMLLRQEEERNSNNDRVYDPKVVSFGPHHHGKPELQHCQEAKHLSLQLFLEGSNQSREFFISEILENMGHIRNSYKEEATSKYEDKDVAEMMLLDASFLIFYMGIDGEKNMEIRYNIYHHIGVRWVFLLAHGDMFLLENQIPYQVITLLISLRYGDEGIEAVDKFLYTSTVWRRYSSQELVIQQQQHQYYINLYKYSQPPLHLLEAFRRVLVHDDTSEKDKDKDQQLHMTFRSANDLKAKGIRFNPSSSKSLKGVTFAHGQLQLPIFFVTFFSRVVIPNIIAYELCPNNLVETTVTSYVSILKMLIQSPSDVKELRENRILRISLRTTDEEVMRLFRGINTYRVLNDSYSYAQVEPKIQNHYDNKDQTWKHTYLSSPWALIGWFAAAFLLLLTFTQTYDALYPEK